MSDKNLLTLAEERASDILQNQLSKDLCYHNYDHTKMVVEMVREIGEAEQLSADELEIVLIAAWFHDTGFVELYDGHEAYGAKLAESFLKTHNATAEKIELVNECILVTEIAKTPENKLQQVMRDADISHVAKKEYEEYSSRLREEWGVVMDKHYSDIEWYEISMNFLSNIAFYTSYGKEVLNAKKEKVREKLKNKLKKAQKNTDNTLMSELGVSPEELKSMKKKLLKAQGTPERGIETMFRLTSKNHITLSTMADSKANILISVNSIIISIIIGALMQKLDSNPHLIVPTIMLLTVNLGAIVFSILSIRPNITKGKFTREDIENHRTNLLFFGNFHKMKRDDYHWGMNRLMENKNFLYSSLIDDIYFLGVVLAKKYQLLRTAYTIFMFGIIVAVVAFAVSNFFVQPDI